MNEKVMLIHKQINSNDTEAYMIKLSICMMVKNEERNIRRCLDSLNKLLSEVESELIIVDTGSTDNTVKIASEYTSNIFHHPWRHNFSEMRNITIEYARGTWIFIIDADEVLVDEGPIINFINGPQKDNVVGAAIFLKNAKNYEGTEFGAELITPRIFKKSSGIRYEGAVHNLPIVKGKLLELNSTLHHFGYIQSDDALMEIKFTRTKKLIEESLQKDPDNIYYNFQLSVTYDMHKDFEEAYKQIKKTYNKIVNLGFSLQSYLYIYSSYAKVAMSMEYYSEVVKICEEGIGLNEEYVDLYFFLAGANLRLGNNELGIDNYKKYLKLVNVFETLSIRQNSSIQHYTLNMVEEAYCNSCIVAYKLEKFDYSLSCAREVVNRVTEDSHYYQAVFEVYLNILMINNNVKELNAWYKKIVHSENKDRIVTKMVLYLISSNKKDLINQFFLEFDFKVDEETHWIEYFNKSSDSSLALYVASGYYLDLSLKHCNFNLFKIIEKHVTPELKGIILENFFLNHRPQKEYDVFYKAFESDDSILGFYCKLMLHLGNVEALIHLEVPNEVIHEILTLGLEYYKNVITLLLYNIEFIKYLSKNASDYFINNLLIELASDESNLKEGITIAINAFDDEYIERMGWKRIFRHYLKTMLTINNEVMDWSLLERYHQYLLNHLERKYNADFILSERVDNFSNNEEAYGVALMRSGYFEHISEPRWLLTASELMPITAKYLSIKLSELDREIEEGDSLENELKDEILKLYNKGDMSSAFLILKEGLMLRPDSTILMRLKSNLENQMN